MYIALCISIFVSAYLLNILTVSIGYHRGLAHGALALHPRLRKLVINGGNWLTGLDPKAWVVMHRLHHAHSDTDDDPHSPANVGLLGIGLEQLRSYKRVIIGLLKSKPAYTRYAKDLDFELNALTRTNRWWVPYALHAAVGLALGAGVGWLMGVCYFAGVMSHPVQGGIVNSLGHAVGPRNFPTPDNSRNNHVAAWLIFGEGFQNNHHQYPASASFSYRWYEVDMGYAICLLLQKARLLTVNRAQLIPRAKSTLAASPSAVLESQSV
ncbi:MAG: fatty acid desaturase [Clostridia bacterium]|nr:fatty acid desaturase [Deltaproteobacteria bacterium]